ncbi:mechanosensitive ion channel domain-containing protein [Marinobacter sp. BGYM27]|uniref:mechanosensitive ion channel family protein n=1 Tax=unclassified Marinobacter TaxID=83889 RepID=UPI0021A8C3BE|nr:mechanosensitive ion channel [Marinobacter sp. BGYM27]
MNPDTINEWLNYSLITLGDVEIRVSGVLAAFAALIITMLASRVLRRGLDALAGRRQSMNDASIYTIKRMVHYALIALGILVALSFLGLDMSKMAIIAGALGVGIGFGLQNIVNNFVSGIIILFDRTLKVGDFMELASGLRGEVQAIHIRSTIIRTPDNIEIIIPNSELVNGQVTNWTFSDANCRLRIPFGVAYGSDKELVRKSVLEVVTANAYTVSGVTDRDAKVWMTGFGDSSLDFVLAVWIQPEVLKRQSDVISSYLWGIDDVFRREGIEVPFPQRDLHLRSAGSAIQIERVAPNGEVSVSKADPLKD